MNKNIVAPTVSSIMVTPSYTRSHAARKANINPIVASPRTTIAGIQIIKFIAQAPESSEQ